MISLQFLGGAGTVTGSKYALTVGSKRVFIDSGLFQGRPELRERNWQPLPVQPAEFSALLLTHAHIDHSGYIPRLVKEGFRGPIFCTAATRELTQLLLRDSARLQQEEADSPAPPLYDEEDVEASLPLLQEVAYGRKVQVVPGVQVTFHEAGHILGSAWLELDLTENGESVKLVMSGDLGRENAAILRDPESPVDCDYLVVESTYGDHVHQDRRHRRERLREVIEQALEDGGSVIIPAFSIGRTQELLYEFEDILHRQRRKPGRHAARWEALKIYLDSPLAGRLPSSTVSSSPSGTMRPRPGFAPDVGR